MARWTQISNRDWIIANAAYDPSSADLRRMILLRKEHVPLRCDAMHPLTTIITFLFAVLSDGTRISFY